MASEAPTREHRIQLPSAFQPLFRPARYKVYYGGRGAGKSWAMALSLLVEGVQQRHRVLCTREFQSSIRDSVHALLTRQIELLGLTSFYQITRDSIVGVNGTEFIFAGLRRNIDTIRSKEGVTRCWVEEGQRVSEESWSVLIPTIREPGSEIWVSFNPDQEDDPTFRRFVSTTPPDSVVRFVSWRDNPWLTPELARERDHLAEVDPDAYAHVWEGQCRQHSDAQVLRGRWRVDSFEPADDWHGPYFGADWGFAQDPTVLVRCWLSEDRTVLYIDREAYGVGVEISDTPALFEQVPGARQHRIRADSARPETISHVRKSGYRIEAAKKWSGSVEDGVAFLRSFREIVIHDRCPHAIEEARLYSFKVDQLTGDVKPQIEDRHNHIWDAVRYALQPLIRQRSGPMIGRA